MHSHKGGLVIRYYETTLMRMYKQMRMYKPSVRWLISVNAYQ